MDMKSPKRTCKILTIACLKKIILKANLCLSMHVIKKTYKFIVRKFDFCKTYNFYIYVCVFVCEGMCVCDFCEAQKFYVKLCVFVCV